MERPNAAHIAEPAVSDYAGPGGPGSERPTALRAQTYHVRLDDPSAPHRFLVLGGHHA